MTTTTTPAARHVANALMAAEYGVSVEVLDIAITDSRAALASWAGRDGRYTHSDTEAVLQGHGETFGAWVDHCCAHALPDAYDAAALLTWLGY